MYVNPYEGARGRWFKVNFHAHAGTGPNTCGSNSIADVVKLYKQYGYDALCISNHDRFTDASAYADDAFAMIPGVEYSREEGHMLTIGVDRPLHALEHQAAIDSARAMGGFAVICHPHWLRDDYWTADRLLKLRGYLGIEVANLLIYRLEGSGIALDVWDDLLTRGRLVYGFGSDDFHLFGDVSRSFTLVLAPDGRSETLMDAVKRGAICASTGLFPDVFSFTGDELRVGARYPNRAGANRFCYRFIGEGGRLLSQQCGAQGCYALQGERYVRAEAHGENGAMLFFQPIYRRGALTT